MSCLQVPTCICWTEPVAPCLRHRVFALFCCQHSEKHDSREGISRYFTHLLTPTPQGTHKAALISGSLERRAGWEPLACILDDVAAAGGCVNRVEEVLKQFLRGTVAQFLAGPSVQIISSRQDVLRRERLNGHSLGHESPEQTVVALVLRTLPGGVRMGEIDLASPVFKLGEAGELRAVVHGIVI